MVAFHAAGGAHSDECQGCWGPRGASVLRSWLAAKCTSQRRHQLLLMHRTACKLRAALDTYYLFTHAGRHQVGTDTAPELTCLSASHCCCMRSINSCCRSHSCCSLRSTMSHKARLVAQGHVGCSDSGFYLCCGIMWACHELCLVTDSRKQQKCASCAILACTAEWYSAAAQCMTAGGTHVGVVYTIHGHNITDVVAMNQQPLSCCPWKQYRQDISRVGGSDPEFPGTHLLNRYEP